MDLRTNAVSQLPISFKGHFVVLFALIEHLCWAADLQVCRTRDPQSQALEPAAYHRAQRGMHVNGSATLQTQRVSALTSESVRTTILPQVFLTDEYMAIAMEFAAGGDMFQLVVRQRGLPEADARWYFQQLIIAIDYCHRMVRLLCNKSLLQHKCKCPSLLLTTQVGIRTHVIYIWHQLKLNFLPYKSVPSPKLIACSIQCNDMQFFYTIWFDNGMSFFLLYKPVFGSALCMIDQLQHV